MEVIHTDKAPNAIGPYEQAIKANGFVYTAGQIGLEPATGELVAGGVEEQARRVLDNVTAVLEAAGSSWGRVVKTTIYLSGHGRFRRCQRHLRKLSGFRQARPHHGGGCGPAQGGARGSGHGGAGLTPYAWR